MTATLESVTALRQRAYTSMWRTRSDAWGVVADTAKRLLGSSTPVPAHPALQAELTGALDVLAVLERYWARPGADGIAEVRAWCRAEEYAGVLPVARAAVHPANGDRPAFQVLVVDESPDAADLDDLMRQARRPEDRFVYDLVVVPSFEDALLAVLLNADIQACVLRPGFALAAPNRSPVLEHFRLTPEPDLNLLSADEVAVVLGRRLADLRPEIDLYLMAQGPIETTAGRLSRHFRRIFDASDTLELHLSILRGVAARHETRSSPRCGTTAANRPGCSTPCPSPAGIRWSILRGSARSSTSTG